jgi:hypothetical protein
MITRHYAFIQINSDDHWENGVYWVLYGLYSWRFGNLNLSIGIMILVLNLL